MGQVEQKGVPPVFYSAVFRKTDSLSGRSIYAESLCQWQNPQEESMYD